MPLTYTAEAMVRRHGKTYKRMRQYTTSSTIPGLIAACRRLETVLAQRPQLLSKFDVRMRDFEATRSRAATQAISMVDISERVEDIDAIDRQRILDAIVEAVRTGNATGLNRAVAETLSFTDDDEDKIAERAAEQRKRAAGMYAVTATVVQGGGRIA